MLKLPDRLRAVAFDLDGTLIDTMPDLAAAVNLMLRMLGARELPETSVRALVGRGVDQLVLQALTESLGTLPSHPAQRSAAIALFRRLYAQGLYRRSSVYPGIAQTLRALAGAGLSLCCITNKDSMFAVPLLETAGLSESLAFTLCADRAELRKPRPQLLLAACSRLAIAPAEMLYVGDSGLDMQAAQAAGCPFVAVTYGYGTDLPGKAAGGTLDGIAELLTLLPQRA
ncbi:MAG TPA: phosphoglycolate phosphatase [Steroidobacteraceae bacterium]